MNKWLTAHLIPLIIVALFGAGCGSDRYDGEPSIAEHASAQESESQAYGGNLTALVQRMSHSTAWNSCDDRDHAIRARIALALDLRRDEISAYALAHPQGSRGYRRQSYGPLTLRVPLRDEHQPSSWQSDEKLDWLTIGAIYDRVADLPVNIVWEWINTTVRSHLVDDESRLIAQSNMYITHADVPALLELDTSLSDCVSQAHCVLPELSAAALGIVTASPQYQQRYAELSALSDVAAQREALAGFAQWVHVDTLSHRFRPRSAARRSSRRVLQLHLDPGVLTEAMAPIEQAVEAMWRTTGFRLEIIWDVGVHAHAMSGTLLDVGPRPYLLEFTPESGGRAYVSYNRSAIRIFNDVRLTTLAHEVGHILGFPDRYYTTFDSSNCRYSDETNPGDLMSTSATGRVQRADFRTLRQAYSL